MEVKVTVSEVSQGRAAFSSLEVKVTARVVCQGRSADSSLEVKEATIEYILRCNVPVL